MNIIKKDLQGLFLKKSVKNSNFVLIISMVCFLSFSFQFFPGISGYSQAAPKSEPLSADIEQHFRYGHEFYMMKKYTQALVEFENVKLMAPQSILGYLWTGKSFIKLKNFDQAVIELNKALAIDPENESIRKLLDRYSKKASIEAEPEVYNDSGPPFKSSLKKDDSDLEPGLEYEKVVVQSEEPTPVSDDDIYLPGMENSLDNKDSENADLNEIHYSESVYDPEAEESCQRTIKKIKNAVFSYNLDHLDEMTEKDFSISKLIEKKYLTDKPLCPSKGKYVMQAGEIFCTFHNYEMIKTKKSDNNKEVDW